MEIVIALASAVALLALALFIHHRRADTRRERDALTTLRSVVRDRPKGKGREGPHDR